MKSWILRIVRAHTQTLALSSSIILAYSYCIYLFSFVYFCGVSEKTYHSQKKEDKKEKIENLKMCKHLD